MSMLVCLRSCAVVQCHVNVIAGLSEELCSCTVSYEYHCWFVLGVVQCWSVAVRFLVGSKKDVNDPATHKWMLYVRGPKDEPRIDHFVDKVIFLLHDTYKPNNIVTLTCVLMLPVTVESVAKWMIHCIACRAGLSVLPAMHALPEQLSTAGSCRGSRSN